MLVDILDRRAGKIHSRSGPVLAALAEILTHHGGMIMTTYNLNLTLNEGPIGSSVSRVLASLTSDEPEVMAATLRALADRLDPPKPVTRPRLGDALDAVRSQGVTVRYTDDEPPTYVHTPECNTLHDGPEPCPPPRRIGTRVGTRIGACDQPGHGDDCKCPKATKRPRGSRITTDGCGPEHTFTGSCHLTPPGAVTA